MNLRKNIMMIVSVMVAVIIALSVLVPVIQDSSASEDTFTNTGYIRMHEIDDTDEVTIIWDSTKPNSFNVDGVDVPISLPDNNRISVAFGDDWIIRSRQIGGNMDYLVRYGSGGGGIDLTDNFTLAFANGTLTITKSDNTTVTNTYTKAYIPSIDGEYIIKYANQSAYILKDTVIIGQGITTINNPVSLGTAYGLNVIADVENGSTFTAWRMPTAYTYEFKDTTMNYTPVNGYKDLYSFNSCTTVMTVTSTTDPTSTGDNNVSYSYVLVPYEVTAERTTHVSSIEASLLGIIPLLVVIGIVIGAVWFIRQKN